MKGIIFMLVQCLEYEMKHMEEGCRHSVSEIFEYYKNIDVPTLVNIYKEYYGEE